MKRIPVQNRASLTSMIEQAAAAEKERIQALQAPEIDGVSGGVSGSLVSTTPVTNPPGSGGTMGMIDPNPPGSDTSIKL